MHNLPEAPKEVETRNKHCKKQTNATYETIDAQTKQNCKRGTVLERSVETLRRLKPDLLTRNPVLIS